MANLEVDLISTPSGSVVAPAGCGKTQLIIDSLVAHPELEKPVLILTHTNAGVAALRNRLIKNGVSRSSYKVSTIDGWAMRLVAMFPDNSKCPKDALLINNPGRDYEAIRVGALKILNSGCLNGLISSTYSHLLVDEYQDCQATQHLLVLELGEHIHTCVVGDPLQAIFSFGSNKVIPWNEVTKAFPLIAELKTPWRWINAGTERLGKWLIDVRPVLLSGGKLDLNTCPDEVKWIRIDPQNAYALRLEAANNGPAIRGGDTLVIGESTSPTNQQRIASQTPGATTVESADFKDLISFSKIFDHTSQDAFSDLVNFCSLFVANVSVDIFLKRVRSLKNGTARIEATEAEGVALEFLKDQSLYLASLLLEAISRKADCRTYRPDIFRTAIDALQLADQGSVDFYQAVIHYRDLNRYIGRRVSKRAVGSTLLLKGLEADTVILLHPERMDAENLYVALTRGSNSIIVCSEAQLLPV